MFREELLQKARTFSFIAEMETFVKRINCSERNASWDFLPC